MTHPLRTHEMPLVVTPGAVRIELSCDCCRGYIYSRDAERVEHVREMVKAAVARHAELVGE